MSVGGSLLSDGGGRAHGTDLESGDCQPGSVGYPSVKFVVSERVPGLVWAIRVSAQDLVALTFEECKLLCGSSV